MVIYYIEIINTRINEPCWYNRKIGNRYHAVKFEEDYNILINGELSNLFVHKDDVIILNYKEVTNEKRFCNLL